jgi:copper homeostasis protein
MKLLEIAVFSAEAAVIAANAGADRLELCSGYAEGGLTPSMGTLHFVEQHVKCPVFVMIRPRGGNFCYSRMELDVMKHDIERCKTLGAGGIVLGALTKDNAVNVPAMNELVQLASPLPVTFHRAFDVCYDPFEAMETLIRCGVKRILTSGQKASAEEGAALIKTLQEKANGRIVIMPGAGINPGNIAAIVEQTGCTEFHASARRISPQSDSFGFGEHVMPHPEIIGELKLKLTL